MTYNGVSSSDPDGDTLTYVWNVGDGLTRIGSNTSRWYWDEGSYDVTLIVSDQHGASDTATTRVSVQNVAPVVGGIETPAGSILRGTSSGIRVWAHDPGINDSLTLQIDWKDGDTTTLHFERQGFINQQVAHTYSDTGSYAVGVTVRDNGGGVNTRAVENPIVVVGPHTNHPPVARIEGLASGREGAALRFSADASTDPDGDSLTATWFSGDGRSEKTPYQNYLPRTNTHWWTYPDNGPYTVSVIVADDSGAADTASFAVTVLNAPPVVSWFLVPVHEAAGIPGSIQVLVADSGTADRQTIVVDWGDGAGQTVSPADTSIWSQEQGRNELGGTVFHTYATTGTYSITVRARDDDGGVSTPITSAPVVVINANARSTVAGYEVIDLGTLGGNAARPADINNRGQVVGTSTNGFWAERGFLWDENGIHELGAMGQEGSEAVRINEAGVIAGTVWTYGIGVLDDNMLSSNIAMTWQNGVAKALSTTVNLTAGRREPAEYPRLFQQPARIVRAINGSGEIAWASYGKWNTRGLLWRNGSWLGLPSYPMAMNDRGQVVGASSMDDGFDFHAFLWDGQSARKLDALTPIPCQRYDGDCSTAAAMDINETGQIVGISTDAAGRYHFVLWEDDKIKDLGAMDWASPQTGAPRIVINGRGEIAGSAAGKAFFWSTDTMIALPAGGSIEVVGLNERGEVAGTMMTGAQQHAFVWSKNRGMVDLGTGPYGFAAAWVVDINDRGDIVGYTGACGVYPLSNRCWANARPNGLRWSQVRGILWRNMQATASR